MTDLSLDYGHNYWMEERDDEMQGKWAGEYEEYLAECKETGEKPISFDDFWREREGDL